MTARDFVYHFGYETPDQAAANAANGWDDESSAAFIVVALDEEHALRWGDTVAGAFVSSLFAAQGRPYDWFEAQFASWIEERPETVYSPEELRDLPRVTYGEMPDLQAIARRAR